MKLCGTVILGAIVLLVAGCVDTSEELAPAVGRPASELFTKLGFPDSEGVVAGRKYYVWQSQAFGSNSIPVEQTGTIYNRGFPTTYKYTTYTQVSHNETCKIRAFVDSQEYVTNIEIDEAGYSGCSGFYDF